MNLEQRNIQSWLKNIREKIKCFCQLSQSFSCWRNYLCYCTDIYDILPFSEEGKQGPYYSIHGVFGSTAYCIECL